ncbi:unannotated protein [freshwater metagenome]|uniref:Unannotated protein n=1 Tax=freshwater metagenome TaxID=449393 RepID=A0A6J7HJC8_9ZZZZ|nr:hypothetical protein [Actinomycetota bacterium]
MFNRNKHHDTTTTSDTHVVKGAGLARGPALVLGTILAAAGLVLFLHAGGTPTGGFPDADARGEKFLGFESNGWTAFFTTTAGVILLFAAAQHLLAKLLGLGVGLALAACVILDLVNGPGVLGLAAANWAVDLGWAIAAVLLLLNVFAPRITHEDPVGQHTRLDQDTTRVKTAAPATRTETTTGRHDDPGVVGPSTTNGHDRDHTTTGATPGTPGTGGASRID